MTHSNQRPFVLQYNSDEIDRLAHRAVEGVRSNKIRPVDYEKLRNIAAEKKFSAHKTLLKVKKFEHLSKQNKENHLLKQHKMVWQKEFIRLNSVRKRTQADIDIHVRGNSSQEGACSQMYSDFEDYQSSLESEFGTFKQATTDPVWALREDLQYWLHENMSDLRLGAPDVVDKHNEIRTTIQSVKTQQQHVMERLKHEQICLERELNIGEYGDLGSTNLYKRPNIEQGIPEDAFDLECPDADLKANVLKEFIVIDEKYLERLTKLEDDHRWTLSQDAYGGWTESDHTHFVLIYDQYPYDMANRRMLVIDRIKRQIPTKNRAEIVEHEQWWDTFRFFNQRCKAIMSDWQRDRRELMAKARTVFTEACVAHELEEVKQEYHKKQEALREALYNQAIMSDWQRDRRELMAKARTVFTEACVAHELEEVKQEYHKKQEALREALYNQRDRRELMAKARTVFTEACVAHELEEVKQEYHRKQEALREALYNQIFNQRCKAIMSDWQRDRRELMAKARTVFTEACVAHELEEVKQEYHRKQEALREALYNQVKHWREQKLEMLAIQAQMWEQQREEIQRKHDEEREKETKKRDEDKKKIKAFNDVKEEKRKEMEEQDRQRLERLQQALAEQAVFDKERIKFRAEQIQRKIEERKADEEERDLEEREKEYRLEMLREKVRVVAESNPDRLMSQTQAWQARMKEDDTVDINKPLFNIHGYTATQVTSDNRVKLEQKLREAGLHNSNYARQILGKVAPPQPPRRDMESTVFKYNQT